MDGLHIALLVIALGFAAAAAWLLRERARLSGLHARARAEQDAAVATSRGEAAAELAKVRAETDSARQVLDLTVEQYEARLEEARGERQSARDEALASSRRVVELSRDLAAMRERVENAEQLRQELVRNEQRLREAFAALSKEALQSNSTEFLKLAEVKFEDQRKVSQEELEKRKAAVEQLVKPIAESLAKTGQKLGEMDQKWVAEHSRLGEQLRLMTEAEKTLRDETSKLVRALSKPEIRGRYGEIQLRRVAELAGMTSYCDFDEQRSVRDSEGALLRPDMIVKLPNARMIAVDAKANMMAYIEAINASSDGERCECLDRFARHIAEQADKLGKKGYWAEFDGSPEFVVMFVPGDGFLDAALSRRPDLLDEAAQRNVILASPATLIGLLRAVAVGWRESRMQEQARELFDLGRELHERAAVALQHASKLGETIERAVRQFNEFAGSVEARLMPTLRRFEDAGARSGKTIEEPGDITIRPRQLATADNGDARS